MKVTLNPKPIDVKLFIKVLEWLQECPTKVEVEVSYFSLTFKEDNVDV